MAKTQIITFNNFFKNFSEGGLLLDLLPKIEAGVCTYDNHGGRDHVERASQFELIDPPSLESEVVRIKEDYARFGLVPSLPGKSWAAHRQSKYGAALSPCMAEYAGKDLQGSSGDSFEMGKRIMLRCICAHSRTFMRCARWTMLQLSSSLHPSYNTMRGGQNER